MPHASREQQTPRDYCDLLLDGFGSKGEERAAQPKAAKRKAEVEGDENKNRAQQMCKILNSQMKCINQLNVSVFMRFQYRNLISNFDTEICYQILALLIWLTNRRAQEMPRGSCGANVRILLGYSRPSGCQRA